MDDWSNTLGTPGTPQSGTINLIIRPIDQYVYALTYRELEYIIVILIVVLPSVTNVSYPPPVPT